MAVRTKRTPRTRLSKAQQRQQARRELLVHYLPAWMMLSIIALIMAPHLISATVNATFSAVAAAPRVLLQAAGGAVDLAGDGLNSLGRLVPRSHRGAIAPLFTAEVQHWSSDLSRWSQEYDLDINLLATVMQIESCGHPTVSSHAGAQGLFQVMPFHFASDENMVNPDTNAMRGALFLSECLQRANGDVGLAMACYNGGPSVIRRDFSAWPSEAQRYYVWGTGIYADARHQRNQSAVLDEWLAAGGVNLCRRAAQAIGLSR